MANYSTVSQAKLRIDRLNVTTQISQLARTNSAAEIDAFLEQYLEEASGLIDAYLDGAYTVPVTTAADNAFLRMLCLDIAVHEMFKRGSGDEVPTKYRKNYEDVIRTLEDIAEGLISVPGVTAKVKNNSIDITTDTPVFTELKLNKYF